MPRATPVLPCCNVSSTPLLSSFPSSTVADFQSSSRRRSLLRDAVPALRHSKRRRLIPLKLRVSESTGLIGIHRPRSNAKSRPIFNAPAPLNAAVLSSLTESLKHV